MSIQTDEQAFEIKISAVEKTRNQIIIWDLTSFKFTEYLRVANVATGHLTKFNNEKIFMVSYREMRSYDEKNKIYAVKQNISITSLHLTGEKNTNSVDISGTQTGTITKISCQKILVDSLLEI